MRVVNANDMQRVAGKDWVCLVVIIFGCWNQNFGEYASNRHEHGCWLTPLAGTGPVSCASAVADEAVPALLTHPLVLAGVALTLLPRHLVAGRFDSRSVLLLSDLPDVFTASVDEQVPDAAHVAVVEHGGPELGGQDETCSVLRKSTKVHITLQVQDLTLSAGRERGTAAVYGYGTYREKELLWFMNVL